MSGRRPRISARPNLAKNKRGATDTPSSSQDPPADGSQATAKVATKDVADGGSAVQSPPNEATQAADKSVEHVNGQPALEAGNRRSKIKAKPMISRKPRARPVTSSQSASVSGTQAESESSSLPEKASQEKTIPEVIVETVETGQEEPVVQEAGLLSPDSTLSAGRQYKPRTKPNVLEAGRARMRRISESLDLSPNHPVNRRHRHNSSGGDNPAKSASQSQVVCEKKDSTEKNLFHEAQTKARKRRHEKDDREAEIDREIIEMEHAEMAPELEEDPKPKKTRKVRRLVKSDQAPDPHTMTIRDLIYYQPTSNPLPSKASKPEAKKKSDDNSKGTETVDSDCESVEADNPPSKENAEDDLAPQLMIGEDGQVIINQQSLTVETAKPSVNYENITVDRDGEGATYASFRASRNARLWSATETAQFYKALAAIGTDFSLMCQLFPNRTRTDLKKKFKREERQSLAKVQLAMQGKLDFEAEPFPEYNKEKEKEEKRKEKQAIRKEQKRRAEPRKLRPYYEVGNSREFVAKLQYRRRLAHDVNLGEGDETTPSENNPDVICAPKKLLQLNTQSAMVETTPSQVVDNQPASVQQSSPSLALPEKAALSRPMPSISTMLHQDQGINNKINNLILAKKTPPRRTSEPGEPLMSPLCQLDNGNTIMVQTQTLGGGDKKVHHLFLYAPNKSSQQDPMNIGVSPKTSGKALSRLAPAISDDTHQQVSAPPVTSVGSVPVTDIRPPNPPFTSPVQVAPSSGQSESPNLTRLVTPKSLKKPMACSQEVVVPHHAASNSTIHVGRKVPTKQLAWKPVVDEFGAVTEEKELTFTDL